MLISAAPVAIPVSTANPPTEAVASEAAQKTPVPEPTPTTENPNTRNSTDTNEHPKNSALQAEREAQHSHDSREQKDSAEDSPRRDTEQQQQKQKEQQQSREVEQLKSIDREVKAHEAAHASAGGQLAGSPQLTFKTGPDGNRYAVAGEVSIDISKVANNPQATIAKMSQVQRAALAPADPSPQDLKVAALSSQIANQARVELNLERKEVAEAALQEADKSESLAPAQSESERPANPLEAKRIRLQLNRRIIDTGALDDINEEPMLRASA